MDALPLEVLQRVSDAILEDAPACDLGDVESCRNFRLVCRNFAEVGIKTLFRRVVLVPEDGYFDKKSPPMSPAGTCKDDDEDLAELSRSMANFKTLLHHEKISELVRTVVFRSSIDGEELDDDGEVVMREAWVKLVKMTWMFRNLSAVTVVFRSECYAYEYYSQNDENRKTEDANFRTELLTAVLEGIEHKDHPLARLQSLTIENLQDDNKERLVKSDESRSLLSRLKSLHLFIIAESNEAVPEYDIEIPELHKFFNSGLPDFWLRPLQQNLTCLTLYSDSYWGWAPRFDAAQTLHFPNLVYLALGNYTIAHDWQVGFITRHGPTLRTLILDDCPIIFFMYSPGYLYTQVPQPTPIPPPSQEDHTPIHLRPGPKDSINTPTPDSKPEYWAFATRWHDIFQRFAAELRHLTKFAIGHGYSFENRDNLRSGLSTNTYIAFEGGQWEQYGFDQDGIKIFGPEQKEPGWSTLGDSQNEEESVSGSDNSSGGGDDEDDENDNDDGDDDGTEEENDDAQDEGCRTRDQQAFDELMEIVAARARETGI